MGVMHGIIARDLSIGLMHGSICRGRGEGIQSGVATFKSCLMGVLHNDTHPSHASVPWQHSFRLVHTFAIPCPFHQASTPFPFPFPSPSPFPFPSVPSASCPSLSLLRVPTLLLTLCPSPKIAIMLVTLCYNTRCACSALKTESSGSSPRRKWMRRKPNTGTSTVPSEALALARR